MLFVNYTMGTVRWITHIFNKMNLKRKRTIPCKVPVSLFSYLQKACYSDFCE